MIDASTRRFHIDACLGRGGFGEVYRARMVRGSFETHVAIKLLRADLTPHSQAVSRLEDEARLLGLLNHRAIPKVLDFLTLDGRLALITEYVQGADLDTCMRLKPPMPLRAGLDVLSQTAWALHAAWTTPVLGNNRPLRIVHRDLKPANIRVTTDGTPRLLDFGIAWTTSVSRVAGTQTGAIIGSPAYMAPERFAAQAPHPSSDVFSLGCVLYEIIRGEQLFEDLSMRSMAMLSLMESRYEQVISDRLAALPPYLAPALRDLVIDCLRFDPKDRPSAETVAQRLEVLVDEAPGPTLSAWARTATWPEPQPEHAPYVGRTLEEGPSQGQGASETRSLRILPEVAAHLAPQHQAHRPTTSQAVLLGLGASGADARDGHTDADPTFDPSDAPIEDEPLLTAGALLVVACGLLLGLNWSNLADMITWAPPDVPAEEATAAVATPAPVDASPKAAPAPAPTPAKRARPAGAKKAARPAPQPTATPKPSVATIWQEEPTAVPTTPSDAPSDEASEARAASQVSTASTSRTGTRVGATSAASSLKPRLSADGTTFDLPSRVPPGHYELTVEWDGQTRTRAMFVTVRPDKPFDVHCVAEYRTCAVQ